VVDNSLRAVTAICRIRWIEPVCEGLNCKAFQVIWRLFFNLLVERVISLYCCPVFQTRPLDYGLPVSLMYNISSQDGPTDHVISEMVICFIIVASHVR